VAFLHLGEELCHVLGEALGLRVLGRQGRYDLAHVAAAIAQGEDRRPSWVESQHALREE
jgi:hypothetical protein